MGMLSRIIGDVPAVAEVSAPLPLPPSVVPPSPPADQPIDPDLAEFNRLVSPGGPLAALSINAVWDSTLPAGSRVLWLAPGVTNERKRELAEIFSDDYWRERRPATAPKAQMIHVADPRHAVAKPAASKPTRKSPSTPKPATPAKG